MNEEDSMKRAFKWSYFNFHLTKGLLDLPKDGIRLEIQPVIPDDDCLAVTNLKRRNTTSYLDRHEIIQVEDNDDLVIIPDPPDYPVCVIRETVYDLNIDPKKVLIAPNPYLVSDPNYSHVLCLEEPTIIETKQRDSVLPTVYHKKRKYNNATMYVDLDLYGKVRKIVIDKDLDPDEVADILHDWLNKSACQKRKKEYGALWEQKQMDNNSVMGSVQGWLRLLYTRGVESFRWSGHLIKIEDHPEDENRMRIFSGKTELNPIDLGRLGLIDKAYVGRL